MNALGYTLSAMCTLVVLTVVCHASAAVTLWVDRRESEVVVSHASVCPHLERWNKKP